MEQQTVNKYLKHPYWQQADKRWLQVFDSYYKSIELKLMWEMNKKPLILLAIGALTLGLSFFGKQYLTLTDATDGFLKGLAIGLMILSLIFSKQVKLKRGGRNLQAWSFAFGFSFQTHRKLNSTDGPGPSLQAKKYTRHKHKKSDREIYPPLTPTLCNMSWTARFEPYIVTELLCRYEPLKERRPLLHKGVNR